MLTNEQLDRLMRETKDAYDKGYADGTREANELREKLAAAKPKRWLAFDIGCIECGEDSAVIGIFASEELAEVACESARKKQIEDWHGQHRMEVFDLPDDAIDAERAGK